MKTVYHILPPLTDVSADIASRRFRVQGVAFSADEMIVTLVEAEPYEAASDDLTRARLNVIGVARACLVAWADSTHGAGGRLDAAFINLRDALDCVKDIAARDRK